MLDTIKQIISAFKIAFFKGKIIGIEGKQKEFCLHPIKTFNTILDEKNDNDKRK